jgi:orotidine-5'-phosphate decarboxylase
MIDRLMDKIDRLENPTVVGLDPVYEMMPQALREEMLERCGRTPEAVAGVKSSHTGRFLAGLLKKG